MARKNPLKGALLTTLIAIVTVSFSYFVLSKRQKTEEEKKEKATLLFADIERAKIVEFRIENPNGAFQLKRRAEANDEWLVSSSGKTFEADKSVVDGLLSTILAAKKESTLESKDYAALGLQPPKFKVTLSTGTQTVQSELDLGEDTPVDYLVYAKWADKPEAFLTTRSLRFGLDKKISDFRNKKVMSPEFNKLTHVEIKTLAHDKVPSQKIVLNKDEKGNWKATSPAAVTVKSDEVQKFIDRFKNVMVTGFASEDPAERAKLGFRRPLAQLVLTEEAGKSGPPAQSEKWTLASVTQASTNADPKAPKQEKYYLAREDEPTTYEVAETFKDNFKTDLSSFRSKQITGVAKTSIDGFSVSDGSQSFEFRKGADGKWTLKASGPKGEHEGPALEAPVDAALTALTSLQAKNFLDNKTPWQLGLKTPTRVVELRGKKDGKDQVLATLFFGHKLSGNEIVVRAEGMEAAASVDLKVDEILPMKAEHFLAPAPSTMRDTAGAIKEGVKRVKLEPTVKSVKDIKKLPAPIVKPGYKYTAEINMEKGGKIVITFAPDKAPYTVSNFLHLARNHFYDGVKFHRVIPDFVAQGGDPTGTGTGGPGYKFDNEDNDLKHKRGAISMAHAGRNTNGSQFFLVLKPQPHLDGVHTVFGEITEGLDVLDSIKAGDVMKTVEVFEEGK